MTLIKTQHLLMFLICFFGYQGLSAQTNQITIKPNSVQHEISGGVIGANRNHTQFAIDDAIKGGFAGKPKLNYYDNFSQARWDEMLNAYNGIKPPSGRKVFRYGHTPTDGKTDNCPRCYTQDFSSQPFPPLNSTSDYSNFVTPVSDDCGYHFANYIPELNNGVAGSGNPLNDDLSFTFEEARALDANAIIVINFGSGSPQEAAAMVQYVLSKTYADGIPWTEHLAFFEIGNEISGHWELGNECTYLPSLYAEKASDFIDAIDNVPGAENVKIGICASHGWDWGWSPLHDPAGQGAQVEHVIEAYTSSASPLVELVPGQLDPNGEPVYRPRYDFVAFHGYNAWPFQQLNDNMGGTGHPDCLYATAEDSEDQCLYTVENPLDQYEELNLRLLGGAIYQSEAKVQLFRDAMDANLYNNTVKIAQTESSAYLQDKFEDQRPFFQSTTEALFLAENIRIAIEDDYETAVSFSLVHFGAGDLPKDIDLNLFYQGDPNLENPDNPKYISDNLFFNYNYGPNNGDVLEKPNFCVQEMIASGIESTVIGTDLNNMEKALPFNALSQNSIEVQYDKVGVVSTKNANGDISVLLINRTGDDVVVNLDVEGGQTYNASITSQGGHSWKSKNVKAGSYNPNASIQDYWYDEGYTGLSSLQNITLKARSINIAKLSPTGVPPIVDPLCTTLPCNVATIQICGNTLSVTPTTSGIQSINVIDPNNGWELVESLCNLWTPPFCTGTLESTLLNADQDYQVNITMSDNSVGCSVPFTTESAPPPGCNPPAGTSCNDDNPNTINDMILADSCECVGTPENSNCEDIGCSNVFTATECDGVLSFSYVNPSLSYVNLLSLPSYTPISLCNWQNPCSNGLVSTTLAPGEYQIDASGSGLFCSGEFTVEGTVIVITDSDGDGIHDDDDCRPFDSNLPTTVGSTCNDFNQNTSNDVIQADGCECAGTPPICGDGSSTFNGCNGDIQIGVSTATDEFGAPGYDITLLSLSNQSGNSVIITPSSPTWQWNAALCNDYGSTSCQSGNPSVFILQSEVETLGSTIVINIVGATNCDSFEIDVLEANSGGGNDTDGDGICDDVDCQPFNPNLPTTVGSPCDDFTAITMNDVIQANGCDCAGIVDVSDPCGSIIVSAFSNGITVDNVFAEFPIVKVYNSNWIEEATCSIWLGQDCGPTTMFDGLSPGDYFVLVDGCTDAYPVTIEDSDCNDTDNDGVCNDIDCAPTNPNLPATPGSACNDFNVNTTNDLIQANGCDCLGTPNEGNNCHLITTSYSPSTLRITIAGITDPNYLIQITDSNEVIVDQCSSGNSCPTPHIFFGNVGEVYTISIVTDQCNSTRIVTFPLGKIDDTFDNAYKQIVITPNPTNGQFSLVGLDNFDFESTLEIYDISGRKVLTEVIANGKIPSTDVSHLMDGIYIVTLTKTDGELVYRGKLSHL